MRFLLPLSAAVGFALAIVGSAFAAAAACADVKFEERSYSVCRFDPKADDLRLFWRGPGGEPLGSFEAAATVLKEGETLVFAMNAGMYDENHAPLGLYVEKGAELHPANTRNGAGNFHLKPNGVFYIGRAHSGGVQAGVMETGRYLSLRPAADYATQSGPMLVVNGKIHPRIHADGVSAKIRNGVGVDREGQVWFAIANEPVTFHQFASLFHDGLHCDNALFLDGSISALYAPNLGRNDFTLPMGPMVGAVAKKK